MVVINISERWLKSTPWTWIVVGLMQEKIEGKEEYYIRGRGRKNKTRLNGDGCVNQRLHSF